MLTFSGNGGEGGVRRGGREEGGGGPDNNYLMTVDVEIQKVKAT